MTEISSRTTLQLLLPLPLLHHATKEREEREHIGKKKLYLESFLKFYLKSFIPKCISYVREILLKKNSNLKSCSKNYVLEILFQKFQKVCFTKISEQVIRKPFKER